MRRALFFSSTDQPYLGFMEKRIPGEKTSCSINDVDRSYVCFKHLQPAIPRSYTGTANSFPVTYTGTTHSFSVTYICANHSPQTE
jgi:hypothetical protein